MATTPNLKRLLKEHQSVQRDLGSGAPSNPDLLELRPYDSDLEDLSEWTACIRAPTHGAYQGGIFNLTLTIPPSYPTKPPIVKFQTPIFHPNVHFKTGEICLDVLSTNSWTPAWTLSAVCTAILALLDAPEPDSPLNVDAANLVRSADTRAYRSVCAMFVRLHALPSD
ncbi:uncharacterized protein PFL1_03522 [Pseudozyma flocculosa PF-1]|uniref:UBC core domain-containing protein n=2 Tax=Pseudozyma flocculosa TaxID=84751 RepID=A0A061H7U6_9BASI|nr:uncharacterized protein PFL1_03522 [Pseudozyma flocculosa PF-1]EPQ28718.1 hypothetical protein PFL1_03522 [Pseudozyma flocculosa PF-1]SPO39511.1 probable ubiquitin-conjugating enzyme E2 [Pseudozyma flocculosa]